MKKATFIQTSIIAIHMSITSFKGSSINNSTSQGIERGGDLGSSNDEINIFSRIRKGRMRGKRMELEAMPFMDGPKANLYILQSYIAVRQT